MLFSRYAFVHPDAICAGARSTDCSCPCSVVKAAAPARQSTVRRTRPPANATSGRCGRVARRQGAGIIWREGLGALPRLSHWRWMLNTRYRGVVQGARAMVTLKRVLMLIGAGLILGPLAGCAGRPSAADAAKAA